MTRWTSLSSSEKRDSTRSHPLGGDSMLEHEASSDGEHVDLSGVPGVGGLSCTSHEPNGMFLAFPYALATARDRDACELTDFHSNKWGGPLLNAPVVLSLPLQVMMVHELGWCPSR